MLPKFGPLVKVMWSVRLRP